MHLNTIVTLKLADSKPAVRWKNRCRSSSQFRLSVFLRILLRINAPNSALSHADETSTESDQDIDASYSVQSGHYLDKKKLALSQLRTSSTWTSTPGGRKGGRRFFWLLSGYYVKIDTGYHHPQEHSSKLLEILYCTAIKV